MFKDLINAHCGNQEFAAKNLICICQANPNAPQCGSINQKANARLKQNGFDTGPGADSGVVSNEPSRLAQGFVGAIKNFLNGNSSGNTQNAYGSIPVTGMPNNSPKPLPDLKQYLPGGAKDPTRKDSTITGPDGITGPYTDNFQKVRVRYWSLRDTFL